MACHRNCSLDMASCYGLFCCF
ncbi:MAG: hypothetical protein KQA33_03035, partial [Candidatus Aenigmarchaeota archaeon]|nr:hypothetical protein [Candidatus Aenigmarchaeota archaeon]